MQVKSLLSFFIAVALGTGVVFGGGGGDTEIVSSVPNANSRAGHPPNVISSGFALQKVAEGSDALENPSGVITTFGSLNDFPPKPIEATKTEPDENTYLVFDRNPGGPLA